MNRLFDEEYETRCDFEFPAGEDEEPVRGEYTIYKDGKVETTCRRCHKQHQVSDKFAEKAKEKNEILENALCIDCWKLEQQVSKGQANMDREITIRIGMVANQTSNLLAKLLARGKIEGEAADETYDKWFEFYWRKVNEKLEEYGKED